MSLTSVNSSSSGSIRSTSPSLTSIGIGSPNEHLNIRKQKQLDIDLIKPKAECFQQSYENDYGPLYDCIMFLIYCTEHDRFAVTDVSNDTIWLPFVLRDGRNWHRASETGLQSMFEKRDCDGVVISHVNIPHTSKMIELCRIQSTSGRWVQRATQFVTITKCQQTCQPINSIRWMDAGSILKDDSAVWGPEFRRYLEHLERRSIELKVREQSIEAVIRHLHTHEKLDLLSDLIKSRSLTQKLLLDFYENYLRHTYPSCYMNFGSFRIYLQKCGIKTDIITQHAKSFFRCCLTRIKRDCKHGTFVDFHDLCYLMIGLDPELPNDRYRQQFYAHLNEQISETAARTAKGSKKVSRYGNSSGSSAESTGGSGSGKHDGGKTSKTSSIMSKTDSNIAETLKLQKSVFTKFGATKKKKERLVSDKSSLNRGVCRNCRVKSFEYGQHYIMFDSMVRCVEPKLIPNADHQFVPMAKLEGRKLYSVEHVFKPDSIGNALFDYMRNRKFSLSNSANFLLGGNPGSTVGGTTGSAENQNQFDGTNCNNTGVRTSIEKADEEYLVNAILTICENVRKLLKYEPKLIKRAGPAIIIGDIKGNLNTLCLMEQYFWSTMPVIASNLIFLGNYTGINQFSIETIIYLLSIKYLSPNKVILLKGVQETRSKNDKTLGHQCRTRYGDDKGNRIWKAINQVYDEMPYVCIINESIVCASSGIPKDATKYKLISLFDGLLETQKLSEISQNVSSQPKEFTIFQHILVNTPDHKENDNFSSCLQSKLSNERSSPKDSPEKTDINQNVFKPNPMQSNAFIFNKTAFRNFMTLNNFSYMIRSNEYVSDGFRLSYNNRLITINSYVDLEKGKNEVAVAFVHHPNGEIQLKLIEQQQIRQQQTSFSMSNFVNNN